jgi:MFS family permease
MPSVARRAPAPRHTEPFETDIPARLDRLPWTRFHTLLVVALGITWVLDGLEATVVAAVTPILEQPTTLGLGPAEIGLAATLYIVGLIVGSLFFGWLTDRLGRKKLFTVTLAIYLVGALLTALAWSFASFAAFRFLTGLAIGGEYSAINSAIDELIPARVRGRVDLAVNGTFWLGAILGSATTLVLLTHLDETLAWRVAFGLGVLVGGAMILARRHVPESPRWLLTHGRVHEAEAVMASIERHMPPGLPPPAGTLCVDPRVRVGFATILRTLVVRYRRRAVLGLVLISSQAIFYNGMSFTFPLVLTHEFGVAATETGAYILWLAVANLLGPLVLGHFFDTVGRRRMITGSYALAGAVVVGAELLFLRGQVAGLPGAGIGAALRHAATTLLVHGQLTAESQTLLWCVAFFFASAAASAGYLTVSEIFPVEMRGLAIALFFALGTSVAAGSPLAFGWIVESGRSGLLAAGYGIAGGVMLVAAATEWWLGGDAERRSLEEVSTPLTAMRAPLAHPAPAHDAAAGGPRAR